MSKRCQREPAATQAQRNSLTFKAVEPLFDWDNETWALTFLPRIRLASALLNNDERGCDNGRLR